MERLLITTGILEDSDFARETQPARHPFFRLLLGNPILPNSPLLLKQNFEGLLMTQLLGGQGTGFPLGTLNHYSATTAPLRHISYQHVRLLEEEAQGISFFHMPSASRMEYESGCCSEGPLALTRGRCPNG